MAITQTIKKRFIASLLLGVVIFFLLLTYANTGSVMRVLSRFTWTWVPLVILLVLGNYAIRFAKWTYYTRRLGIPLATNDSLAIFMSGLMMAVTPGKLGELVKSYFVKNVSNVPMSRTASIVLAERFTDLVGVLTLVIVGSFSFTYGRPLIWVSIGIVTLVMCIVMNRPVSLWVIRQLVKIKRLNAVTHKFEELYQGAYTLLSLKPLLLATALSVISWFFECVAFTLIFDGLGIDLGLGYATFVYAFATLFGALSFLPGGLGVAEGSLTGLLVLRGTPKDTAAAATLLVRAATLWFAVLIGSLWFLACQKRLLTAIASKNNKYST